MNTFAMFWQFVKKTENCWVWEGPINSYGYGEFNVRNRRIKAHRFAFTEIKGEIPDGLHLDHTCHNDDITCKGGNSCLHRRCVNPAHLEAVTLQVNISRGKGVGRHHFFKTHCPQGHPYDEKNTYRHQGHRYCRTCKRRRSSDWTKRTKRWLRRRNQNRAQV